MAAVMLAAAMPKLKVSSAGLNALIGKPADDYAIRLMQERGLDLAPHRATQINRLMCVDSDIILVMEREQRQRLQQLYPEVCGRVFRIAEHANLDVPDPYRRPIEAFQTALTIIDRSVAQWLRRIQRL